MSFDELVNQMNEVLLGAFETGTYTLTRSQAGSQPEPITGILTEGVEPEGRTPGDGSTYAHFWTAGVSPSLAPGDEIATETTVYKIVGEPHAEGVGNGVEMLLRMDRAVT